MGEEGEIGQQIRSGEGRIRRIRASSKAGKMGAYPRD